MKLSTRIILGHLENSNLPVEDRTELLNAIMDKLQALPIHGIIGVNGDGQITIRGKEVEYDVAVKLSESAKSLQDNYVRKFIRDQVLYEAITLGTFQGSTPEQIMFAKSAIWFGQQEEKFINILAN